MAGTRISLTRIGDVRLEGQVRGGIETLVRRDIASKLSRGEARTLDVLHETIKSDPKTRKVISESTYLVTKPANVFLGNMVQSAGETLNAEKSFSTSVKRSGSKRVSIQRNTPSDLIPSGVQGEGWPRLASGYLRSIGALKRAGRLKKGEFSTRQGTKHWWYERRREGSKAPKGQAMGESALPPLKRLGRKIAVQRPSRYMSKHGVTNHFTLSSDTKRRRARTYTSRSRKGKSFVVYGVTGDLVGPSKLTLATTLDKYFNRLALESLMSGEASSPNWTPKSAVTAGGRANGLALMLVNEYRRPWMAKFFAKGNQGLVKAIQRNLASRHAK